MAKAEQTTTPETNDAITGKDLRGLVESIRDMTPKRKVLFSEFKTRSTFNPTGSKSRKLVRTTYQNGQRLNIALLFDEEIKLLNGLKPGRYIDGLVTVKLTEGRGGNVDKLNIEFANSTHDQRIDLAGHVRSFVHMLRQITEEQDGK